MVKRLLLMPLTVACLSAAGPAAGRAIYVKHCQACHGANGSAATTAMGRSFKMRDLPSADVQKQTDAELFDVILKGRNGRMPSFGESLGPAKIRNVIVYLRTMKAPRKK